MVVLGLEKGLYFPLFFLLDWYGVIIIIIFLWLSCSHDDVLVYFSPQLEPSADSPHVLIPNFSLLLVFLAL